MLAFRAERALVCLATSEIETWCCLKGIGLQLSTIPPYGLRDAIGIPGSATTTFTTLQICLANNAVIQVLAIFVESLALIGQFMESFC